MQYSISGRTIDETNRAVLGVVQNVRSGRGQLICSVQADLKDREKKGADG